MKIVFIAGLQETGKNEIVGMVLKNMRSILPEINLIDFDDILAESMQIDKTPGELDITLFNDMKNIRKIQKNFSRLLEKKMVGKVRTGRHLVVNGYFTLHTPEGEMPLVSETFFDTYRPEAIINIELELIKGDPDAKRIVTIQDINRNHASNFSAVSGADLKIIKVRKNNFRPAINEIVKTMKFIFS